MNVNRQNVHELLQDEEFKNESQEQPAPESMLEKLESIAERAENMLEAGLIHLGNRISHPTQEDGNHNSDNQPTLSADIILDKFDAVAEKAENMIGV